MSVKDWVKKIVDADQERLKSLGDEADAIARKKADEVRSKAEGIKGKIGALIDQKQAVLDKPHSRSEILESLKAGLKEGRKKWFMDDCLIPYIKSKQSMPDGYLSAEDLTVHVFTPLNCWKLAFGAITEKDLEEAVSGLPEGITMADREKEIAKIDAEIGRLQKQIGQLGG